MAWILCVDVFEEQKANTIFSYQNLEDRLLPFCGQGVMLNTQKLPLSLSRVIFGRFVGCDRIGNSQSLGECSRSTRKDWVIQGIEQVNPGTPQPFAAGAGWKAAKNFFCSSEHLSCSWSRCHAED